MPQPDDQDDKANRLLMLRAQRGELEAFEQLFERFRRPLYSFFFRLCRDSQRAEDYLQEVFLRLWKSAPRYHPSGRFTTYLFQIAKNFWLNERERNRHRDGRASLDAPVGGLAGGDNAPTLGATLSSHDSAAEDPAEIAQAHELTGMVLDALEELDDRHRMTLVLALFNRLKYREIAEILEIPEGTVKSRVMHAERKLREKLRARDPRLYDD